MKKFTALFAALIILWSNALVVRPSTMAKDEPNTEEEIERLREIFTKLNQIVSIVRPFLQKDLDHLSEVNNVRFTFVNYPELFKSLYPGTVRALEARMAKQGKSSARGKSYAALPAEIPIGTSVGIGVAVIEAVKQEMEFWTWWDHDIEAAMYKDMVARGVPEELAMKEANYQSDRIAGELPVLADLMMPLGGLALTLAQMKELLEELNDNERYNLKDYFARERAGRHRGIGNRHPLPVGGDDPYGYFIGVPGPGGGCVIVGPGPMAGGDPGDAGYPRFGDNINVNATPLDPCN